MSPDSLPSAVSPALPPAAPAPGIAVLAAPAGPGAGAGAGAGPAPAPVRPYTERVAQFGGLGGILSLPATRDPARPVVLVPNTGLEHRIGPNRMHVEMARAIAAHGFVALRLDVAGLGDSDAPTATATGADVADPRDGASDLVRAMDWLEKNGYGRRFALFGLCSGANACHRAAVMDARVAGAVFVDGYVFTTRRARLRSLLYRVRRTRLSALAARLRARPPGSDAPPSGLDLELYAMPTREAVAKDLQAFMARGMKLGFLFTGDIQSEYNYWDQMLDLFPFLKGYRGMTLLYLRYADHTLTRRDTREELTALAVEWLRSL